jgi:phage tail-like protein
VTDDAPNGDSPGLFQTFVGSGFGTVQIERAVGSDPPPPAVSGRRYLRDNLPSVYSDGDFGMRLVSGFELLLDPLVAALDNLPDHFDPVYAPRDVLDLLTEWLGLEHDEARSGEERREIVRSAPELMRRRGTRAGLELALKLAFPGVPFRVEDGGAVTWALNLDEAEPSDRPAFVVYCDVPLSKARLGAVARLIEQAKPAHVSYRLRVKAPPPDAGGTA